MQSAFSAKPFLFMRFTIIIDSVKLYRKSLCLIFMNFHWPWIYSPLSHFLFFYFFYFLPLSIHDRQTVLSSRLVFMVPLTNSKQTEAPKYRKISDSSPPCFASQMNILSHFPAVWLFVNNFKIYYNVDGVGGKSEKKKRKIQSHKLTVSTAQRWGFL